MTILSIIVNADNKADTERELHKTFDEVSDEWKLHSVHYAVTSVLTNEGDAQCLYSVLIIFVK